MVKASHVIFGAYGFWLPNDERGSWSDFVGSWELLRFGEATTVNARQSLARRPFDPAKRAAAQAALKYPPVELTGVQARAVGRGFAEYAAKSKLSILACAIMPKHVHLVLQRHRLKTEQLVTQLKGAATRRLIESFGATADVGTNQTQTNIRGPATTGRIGRTMHHGIGSFV